MTREPKKNAKKRIFDAALELFAHKGFSGVGVREIAREAGVNISMVNYYYGGKAAVLKAIVDECFDKYFKAIKEVGNLDLPLEEHVRIMVRTVIDFFRENTALAIIAFDVIPLDIPATTDLKIKWITGIREGMRRFHIKLGFDPDDPVHASLGPGTFFAIVINHFQYRYALEHLPQFKKVLKKLDDDFYDRYAEMMAEIFLHGITGLSAGQWSH